MPSGGFMNIERLAWLSYYGQNMVPAYHLKVGDTASFVTRPDWIPGMPHDLKLKVKSKSAGFIFLEDFTHCEENDLVAINDGC
jgi:hypothetical protein